MSCTDMRVDWENLRPLLTFVAMLHVLLDVIREEKGRSVQLASSLLSARVAKRRESAHQESRSIHRKRVCNCNTNGGSF